MGKPWKTMEENMENHGKKTWKNYGKTMEKSWNTCLLLGHGSLFDGKPVVQSHGPRTVR